MPKPKAINRKKLVAFVLPIIRVVEIVPEITEPAPEEKSKSTNGLPLHNIRFQKIKYFMFLKAISCIYY